jgi:hypothetical protein
MILRLGKKPAKHLIHNGELARVGKTITNGDTA